MKIYNIYQYNPNPFENRECFVALNEEEMFELTKLYLRKERSVHINGRKYELGKEIEVFQIYELEIEIGSDIENIKQQYLKKKKENYKNKWDEALFQENSRNVTKEILTKINGDVQKVSVDKIEDLNLFTVLHPEIVSKSKSLFLHGHFKESVQAAIVELVSCVKKTYKDETGHDLDGKPLMMAAFSEDKPIIKLVSDDVDDSKGIQEGYKFIFAGMVLAIRNPKAHNNFQINKDEALELLLMCSRLMKKLDERIN